MITKYGFILFLFIGVMNIYHLAAAQVLEPLPEVKSMDINTFVSQAQLIEKKFSDDFGLSFKMEIPSNFIIRDDNVLKNKLSDNLLIGEIFNAYGPAIQDVRPYITIQSIKPDRLISAKNWFVVNVLKFGYTLRGIESDKKGDRYDAFYVRLDMNGNTEIVRELGFLNGNRIVTVAYVLPILLWETDRDKQIFSIKSFEFLNEVVVQPSEAMSNYSYLDGFSMQYPKSWILQKPNTDSVNALSLSLATADINQFLIANIDVTLVSSKSLRDRIDQSIYETDLPSLIRQTQQKIDDSGYMRGDVIERHEYSLNMPVSMQLTEVYPLSKKQQDVFVSDSKNEVTRELWLTVIQAPEYNGRNYLISMVTPSRSINLYDWAISVKAYETIIESIR